MADEIITELWKIKYDIADEFGCYVKALVAHLNRKKSTEGKQVVDLRSVGQRAEREDPAPRTTP